MISPLLQPVVQQFILANEQDDEKKLVLKHRTIEGIPSSIIADQIIARRKAKTKLPLYYNSKNIIYPPGLNFEQSSSESTAVFKANTLASIIGRDKTVADLTGGFGVDSFFMSRVFKKIIYTEPKAALLEIAQHNHQVLGAKNISYLNSTAEDFIKGVTEKIDCVFIDPSRRGKSNQKVFRLTDCEPNVSALLPVIFLKANYVLIKTSPLLDIQQGIKELKHVEKIWVVSIDNECKELLFFCRKGFVGEPTIFAVNLPNQEEISFTLQEEKNSTSTFSKPLSYLYEPNASILKAGAFKLIGEKLSLLKLHTSTHLYTSKDIYKNFPGRIFKLISIIKPDPKAIKEFFPDSKANVITRNYPLSPEALKKKTKLKDGGDLYLIGFSGKSEKYLVAAERVK